MRTIFRKTRTPKLISLFAGCGGLDLPFHEEGYRVVWANDIDQWACETFKKNFGNIIHKGDICQFDPYKEIYASLIHTMIIKYQVRRKES